MSFALHVDLPWSEELRVHGSPERDAFLRAYAPLVRYLAERSWARVAGDVELDDMVGDGMIGLIEALDRFDPGRGVQFKTFAERRIRGAILDGLRSRDWAPRAMRRAGRELAEAVASAEARLHGSAGDEDIAAELGLTVDGVQELYMRAKGLKLSRLSMIEESMEPADPARNAMDHITDRERCDRLVAEIERLPDRERLVLGLYYEKGLTLREIGETLSITESRVCQIHTRAVARLRGRLLPAEQAPATRRKTGAR